MRSEIEIQSANAPDDGVASLVFELEETNANNVRVTAHMNPDDEVMDADDGDFPQFDCVISVSDFRNLRALFLMFDV